MAGVVGLGPRRSSSRSRPRPSNAAPRGLLSLGASSDEEDEAAALGLNTAVCNKVLGGLSRQPPPRYEDAHSQAAALVSRSPAAPSRGPRPRSLSRGPSEAVRAAAILATGERPPRPLMSRGSSPNHSVANLQRLSSPGMAPSALSAPPTPGEIGSGPAAGAGISSEDASLVANMAARLAQVEKMNQQLSAKVANQSQEVDSLRTALAAAGGAQASASPGKAKGRCLECEELRAQLVDLKQFLADYGLTWVPRSAALDDESAPPQTNQRDHVPTPHCGASAVAESSVSVDIAVIRARVEALNLAAEAEAPQVKQSAGGAAQIAGGSDTLPLTFFADGVKLADWAFMPYGEKPAQELIKTILDGSVPKPLRETYPNGVPLRVVDRTGNGFVAWFRGFSRNDPDLVDGGERLRLNQNCGRAMRNPSEPKSAGERLVSKLPDRVVLKNGRVCDVRGAIAGQLGVPANPQPSVGAAPVIALTGKDGEMTLLDAGRDADVPFARLMVKLEGGQRVKLCMEPHATIGELWEALQHWRASNKVARAGADGRPYVLRQAFPPRAFADMSERLDAASLVPSAALFVAAGDATAA